MDNKKPKHFLIFKILGFVGILVGIAGFILVIVGFGDFESNNFMIGGFLSTFGMFGGIVCLVIGFRSEITKMTTKANKYILKENQEDLTDMVNTSVDVADEAITKVTKAVKEGLKEDQMYCKHCGAQIDSDSKFCSSCGKEQ